MNSCVQQSPATAVPARAVAPLTNPDQLLRMPAVSALTGLSASAIWKGVKARSFPSPVRIGATAVAWRGSALQEWISGRPVATAENAGADKQRQRAPKFGAVNPASTAEAVRASPVQAFYRENERVGRLRRWAEPRGLAMRLIEVTSVFPAPNGVEVPDDLQPSIDEVYRLASIAGAVSRRQPGRRGGGAFNRPVTSVRLTGIRLSVRWSFCANLDELARLFVDPVGARAPCEYGEFAGRRIDHPAGVFFDDFEDIPVLAMHVVMRGSSAVPRLFLWTVVSPSTAAGEVR